LIKRETNWWSERGREGGREAALDQRRDESKHAPAHPPTHARTVELRVELLELGVEDAGAAVDKELYVLEDAEHELVHVAG
jgi:hypothetical protein